MLSAAAFCLALAMYHEARGEGPTGMMSVGTVVINRTLRPSGPKTICDVVKQGHERPLFRCQFSFYCDGRADRIRDEKSWAISSAVAVQMLEHGARIPMLEGVTCYYSVKRATPPYWARGKEPVIQIYNHLFFRC